MFLFFFCFRCRFQPDWCHGTWYKCGAAKLLACVHVGGLQLPASWSSITTSTPATPNLLDILFYFYPTWPPGFTCTTLARHASYYCVSSFVLLCPVWSFIPHLGSALLIVSLFYFFFFDPFLHWAPQWFRSVRASSFRDTFPSALIVFVLQD